MHGPGNTYNITPTLSIWEAGKEGIHWLFVCVGGVTGVPQPFARDLFGSEGSLCCAVPPSYSSIYFWRLVSCVCVREQISTAAAAEAEREGEAHVKDRLREREDERRDGIPVHLVRLADGELTAGIAGVMNGTAVVLGLGTRSAFGHLSAVCGSRCTTAVCIDSTAAGWVHPTNERLLVAAVVV